MKTKIFTSLFFLFIGIGFLQAQSYPVKLQIVDQTKGVRTNASDHDLTNVMTWIDDAIAAQNPRNPGDWWYPMYNNSGATPDGNLIQGTDDWTWELSLNATPGTYEWNPYMKSLGWVSMNNKVEGVSWEGSNLSFTVAEDGTISGVTKVVIEVVVPKVSFILKIIDESKGELTNDLVEPDNTDKNVYIWISGDVSQSNDWWTAMYYDAEKGPTSELIKGANDWTWQGTFEGTPGEYEWTPSMKSLGFKSMNGLVEGVSWEGDNLKFVVGGDGTLSGDYQLVIAAGSSITSNLTDSYRIISEEGSLSVLGEYNTVKIFNMNGNLVSKSNVAGSSYSTSLNEGLYIVSVDNKTHKVIVK